MRGYVSYGCVSYGYERVDVVAMNAWKHECVNMRAMDAWICELWMRGYVSYGCVDM